MDNFSEQFCECGVLVIDFITELPIVTSNRLYDMVGGKTPHMYKSRDAVEYQQEIVLKIKSYLNKNKICAQDVLFNLKAYNIDIKICRTQSGWFYKNKNLNF